MRKHRHQQQRLALRFDEPLHPVEHARVRMLLAELRRTLEARFMQARKEQKK